MHGEGFTFFPSISAAAAAAAAADTLHRQEEEGGMKQLFRSLSLLLLLAATLANGEWGAVGETPPFFGGTDLTQVKPPYTLKPAPDHTEAWGRQEGGKENASCYSHTFNDGRRGFAKCSPHLLFLGDSWFKLGSLPPSHLRGKEKKPFGCGLRKVYFAYFALLIALNSGRKQRMVYLGNVFGPLHLLFRLFCLCLHEDILSLLV